MTSVRDSVLRNISNGRNRVTTMITTMTTTERQEKIYKLGEIERHLVRSCEQIILLNDKIRGLTRRYESAKAEGYRSFRYNNRVRLAVFEGVRNVFYEYARDMAEDIADLRRELYGQNVQIIADTDSESDDDQSIDDMEYDEEYDEDNEVDMSYDDDLEAVDEGESKADDEIGC